MFKMKTISASYGLSWVGKYKSYKHIFDEALKGLDIPIVQNVDTFVRRVNKLNLVEESLSINVYYSENKIIGPLCDITKDEKAKHIDLLYIKNKNNGHYCWIKDLWKLLGKQITKNCLVRDHDHLTGEFRGVAHSVCIQIYHIPRFIPIFFHNFSVSDAHFLVKELGSR